MKKTFKLQELGCANCAAKMEAAIAKLDGVAGVTVNFMRQKMELEAADDRFDAILGEAVKIIKKIEPDVVVEA
jgi:Copper chaperone